jgi:predicted nucleotidyltransferase
MGTLYLRISDDLIIYGEKESRKVHEFLEDCLFYPDGLFSELRDSLKVKLYNEQFLRKHYGFRAKESDMSYQQFKRAELKKSHQFLIEGREVFIRYLKSTRTRPKSSRVVYSYKSMGRVSLKGKIIDDEESIFTPGRYTIRITEVHQGKNLVPNRTYEIFTMRGRFLESAHLGDIVQVRGKLEKIIRPGRPTYQIVLGIDPEDLIIQI